MNRPQFQRKTHRASTILKSALAITSPALLNQVDAGRRARGKDAPPDWPAACFVPSRFLAAHASAGDRLEPQALSSLLAWRMGQGIYRFDASLAGVLDDSDIDAELPWDVLLHLPEWGVYIETSGRQCDGQPLHGFFASIDVGEMDPEVRLNLVLDMCTNPKRPDDPESGLVTIPIPLLHGKSLPACLDAYLASRKDALANDPVARAMLPQLDPPMTIEELVASICSMTATEVLPLVSLLLYLCDRNSDMTRRGKVDRPTIPRPKKTRGGWQLFPASGPREWDVGVRMGAALRAATTGDAPVSDAEASGTGSKRAHVRRAHFHTFLSGPMKDQDGEPIPASLRRREVRWMPPIPINVESLDELPSVIHRVRDAAD